MVQKKKIKQINNNNNNYKNKIFFKILVNIGDNKKRIY